MCVCVRARAGDRGRPLVSWFPGAQHAAALCALPECGDPQRTRLFFFFFVFLGPPQRHIEVPRLGVKSELQLPAYTSATAAPDPSPEIEPGD